MRNHTTRTRQVPRHASTGAQQRADVDRWRRDVRPRALRALAARTTRLRWSPALLAALLDELFTDEELVVLVGNPRDLPVRRYPHAVAMALAIRHSWRPDDLARLTRRLGLSWRREAGPSVVRSPKHRRRPQAHNATRAAAAAEAPVTTPVRSEPASSLQRRRPLRHERSDT